MNALKILQAFDRTDVNVYKGAKNGILKSDQTSSHFHGADGLGNVINEEPDRSQLQDEHAVSAIIRLARQYPKEITLICLGPLTNIALAMRMEENLSDQLKEVIIMGGNYKGVGNVTMAAEFNFYCDPVAARVVLEDLYCPKYLVTWELSGTTFLTSQDMQQYCNYGNKKSDFMRKIFEPNQLCENIIGFCDSVAVAVATNRELIQKSFSKYATVDTESSLTKGMVVIDWNPQDVVQSTNKNRKENIIIVDEINVELYRKLFLDSIK